MMIFALGCVGRDYTLPSKGSLRGWNVVLVTLDATDPARIGTYGGSSRVMPYLDSLAREGVVVEHAYCTTGSTAPSHATIMSGLLPVQHGSHYNGVQLSPSCYWLPEALRAKGYATVGSTSAFFMGKGYGFARGFDAFSEPETEEEKRTFMGSSSAGLALFMRTASPVITLQKPFFAWIHLKGGHAPLIPANPTYLHLFSTKLPPDRLPEAPSAEALLLSAKDYGSNVTSAFHAYYDANLAEADHTLRHLVDWFRARGLLRRTIFIITADHGETFDHGIIGQHWPSPWESTLRIPLIIWSEDHPISIKRISSQLVTTTDITPTLLYLLGLDDSAKTKLSGINFFGPQQRIKFEAHSVSTIVYRNLIVRLVSLLTDPIINEPNLKVVKVELEKLEHDGVFYSVRYERVGPKRILKLVYLGRSMNTLLLPIGSQICLYDIAADPTEEKDLRPRSPTLAFAMLESVRREDPLFALNADAFLGLDPSGALKTHDFLSEKLDPKTVERLRSLGYIR